MKVPFVGGSYTGRSTNINAQECINWYPALDNQEPKTVLALMPTPGTRLYASVEVDPSTPFRCAAVHKDLIYVLIRNTVYSIDKERVATSKGTLTNSNALPAFMASNGAQLLITDGTVNGSYISAAGVLTAVTLPCAAKSLTFQDGYFIIHDDSNFYISGLYDAASWDPLDFSAAEANPDSIKRIISNTRDLWVIGAESAEVFYNSGNSSFPFERISGAVLDMGTISPLSVIRIAGRVFWITDKKQAVGSSGYQHQVVSTPHIDYLLSKLTDVKNAISWSYMVDDNTFWVVTFPLDNKTMQYNLSTGYWNELQSNITVEVDSPQGRHRGNCCVYYDDRYIIGDYLDGTLYELNMADYTENGVYIRRRRAAQVLNKDRVNVIHHSFEVEFEAGVGLTGGVQGENPQAMLDWSDDGGNTWSNERWVPTGKIGERGVRAMWNMLGVSRNRIYRVTVTDPVKWVILGAYADLEACRK